MGPVPTAAGPRLDVPRAGVPKVVVPKLDAMDSRATNGVIRKAGLMNGVVPSRGVSNGEVPRAALPRGIISMGPRRGGPTAVSLGASSRHALHTGLQTTAVPTGPASPRSLSEGAVPSAPAGADARRLGWLWRISTWVNEQAQYWGDGSLGRGLGVDSPGTVFRDDAHRSSEHC